MAKTIVHPLLNRDIVQCTCSDCRFMRAARAGSPYAGKPTLSEQMHSLHAAFRQLGWELYGFALRWPE